MLNDEYEMLCYSSVCVDIINSPCLLPCPSQSNSQQHVAGRALLTQRTQIDTRIHTFPSTYRSTGRRVIYYFLTPVWFNLWAVSCRNYLLSTKLQFITTHEGDTFGRGEVPNAFTKEAGQCNQKQALMIAVIQVQNPVIQIQLSKREAMEMQN